MSYNPLNEPWEQVPFSFSFPYYMVWFLAPEGYLDGYMLDYGSFGPANEQTVWLRIPFSQPFWSAVNRAHAKSFS